ncbi:hypothetical protein KFK09_011583 [Dendrobium nobile]|uniref:Reverse transcriptase domain-containing protein n=1 Tax=Dendrobium nobile TaxID=94219 RepID=A0A8T3BFF5_DENNO|nr:hypothetical protein KFK09_011583 [Dendrobium nobile]
MDLMNKSSRGSLVIRENNGESPKKITHVEGNGKAIADEVVVVTPRIVKRTSELESNDPSTSSSEMKIFVNRFGNSNAIPRHSVINANSHNPFNKKFHINGSSSLEDNINVEKVDAVMPTRNVMKVDGNPWRKKPYIKLDFKDEDLVLSEDGKAVKLREDIEILNSNRLRNSLVIQVFGKEFPLHMVAREEEVVQISDKVGEAVDVSSKVSPPDKSFLTASLNKFDVLGVEDVEKEMAKWKQIAKVKWIEDGDSNTKFFHAFTNAKRNVNWVSQVRNSNGMLTEDSKEVDEVFFRFFQNKWKDKECCLENWPKSWMVLGDEEGAMLEKELSVSEIKEVVMRLLGVIPKILSEEQVAFVKGRSISDHLFLAQEVFNKLRHSKASIRYLAIKLDMEQAYDSMCWLTLKKMMMELGFPVRFLGLVMECVSDPRFSILINGARSNWIEVRSGLDKAILSLHSYSLYAHSCYPMLSSVEDWSNRNKVKHGKTGDSNVMIALIRGLYRSDHWDAYQSVGLFSDKWHPPPPEWLKINIDASLKENYEASIGGIVRNCKGRFVLAFGHGKLHWDITQMELSAFKSLKEALQGWLQGAKVDVRVGREDQEACGVHVVEALSARGRKKKQDPVNHNQFNDQNNDDRDWDLEEGTRTEQDSAGFTVFGNGFEQNFDGIRGLKAMMSP